MPIEPDGHRYPEHRISVFPFRRDLAGLFKAPDGPIDGAWPPPQLNYIGLYLESLGCKSVVHERHYIDRDFIQDFALFYSRSLRSYPNFCQRLHFFSEELTEDSWRKLLHKANASGPAAAEGALQLSYLGFMVVKPLPGTPVGRTVLKTFGPNSEDGKRRHFTAIRSYQANLAGLSLSIDGLAFQQQDQGVSACATTALWSALQRSSLMEDAAPLTPAEITEAASRYLLADGRALPSEGLNLNQLCEAIRAAGLAPVVWRSISPPEDRGQILTYLKSGLPPILAIQPNASGDSHALCGVGLRLGEIQPPTDAGLAYRDAATSVDGLYVHDDRLGPYASAQIRSVTHEGKPRTFLQVKWPDQMPSEDSLLLALVIPVPVKLRLSAVRLRALAHQIAQAVGVAYAELTGSLAVSTHFETGVAYRRRVFDFDLTDDGLVDFCTAVPVSRYVGVIEMDGPGGAVMDVILDATETRANPAVLAVVRRAAIARENAAPLRALASVLGAPAIS